MSNCGFDCFVIGGPWIAENPKCPIHSDSTPAMDLSDAINEIDDLKLTVKELEDRIKSLENKQ